MQNYKVTVLLTRPDIDWPTTKTLWIQAISSAHVEDILKAWLADTGWELGSTYTPVQI